MAVRVTHWAAGKILRLVPERILGRILPGKFSFDPKQSPPQPAQLSTQVRLLISPVNYAGQGWQWGKAVSAHIADATAVNMVIRTTGDFSHPADVIVPLGHYVASRTWQRAHRAAAATQFTHLMVEAAKQPFGALLDETTQQQVEDIQRCGVKVLMLCHGSDIRLPSRHITNNSDSPFLDSLAAAVPKLERTARHNRSLLKALGLPTFVSTPDLLLDVPEAEWLPVVVDPSLWKTDHQPLTRPLPVVAHAPSSASIKGTEIIDPILRKLESEGLLEYRRLEGVRFAEMPALYRSADIVIDQLRLGDYGVAACEAMAAGRVVIGHVSDHARSVVTETTGWELPVVEATSRNLETVVRRVLREPEESRDIAKRGVAFVAEVHDGRRSALVLRPHLQNPEATPSVGEP